MTPEEHEAKLQLNMQLWHEIALVFGYNELAKKTESLGEKSYLRLCRDTAEARYIELGGEGCIDRSDAQTVLILSTRSPHMIFTDKDIEAMRKVVAEYDAK